MSPGLIQSGTTLTEEQLNTLQWAKEFMEKYERKNKKESVRTV